MTHSDFTKQDYALMQKQSDNTIATRNREIRFYDFLFLRQGKKIDDFLALICNLPEWVKIAKKSSSQAYLITDQISIDLLKTKLLPKDITDQPDQQKTYFDFLKETGINFLTVDELIKKLPEDQKSWKKLYDQINILVENQTLSPASLKDLCRVLVDTGFKGDHPETVAVQKELDIIVDSKLARKFTTSNYILRRFEIQGLLNIVNILTTDHIGRGLLIQAPEAHGEDLQKQRSAIAQKFIGYKTSASPEISAKRVRFIYTKKSLELAMKVVKKISEDRDKIASYSPEYLAKYRESITRELANALEKIAVLGYGGKFITSNIDPKDLGIIGSVFLNSWTSTNGGKFHGQFVKPITESSEIKSITDQSQKIKKLSCHRVMSLTNPELSKKKLPTIKPKSSIEPEKSQSICLTRPFGIDQFSYHPADITSTQDRSMQDFLSQPSFGYITSTKMATLLLSMISSNFITSSNSSPRVTSFISSSKASLMLVKDLARPSSAPALTTPANSLGLKRIEEKAK